MNIYEPPKQPITPPPPPAQYSEPGNPQARKSLIIAVVIGLVILGAVIVLLTASNGEIIDEILNDGDSGAIFASFLPIIAIFFIPIFVSKNKAKMSSDNKRAMVLILALVALGIIGALAFYLAL